MCGVRRFDNERMSSIIRKSLKSLVVCASADEGQTMAEYGILVAVIAVVVIVAATLLGTSISSVFNSVAGAI